MKLLVISHMYPNEDEPINGIFVHEQVKALRMAGVDARVVSGKPLWLALRRPRLFAKRFVGELRDRQQGISWDEYDGVPYVQAKFFAGTFSQPANYPLMYRDAVISSVRRLMDDFPFDLVHAHTAYMDGRAGISASAMRKAPLVITEHTGPFSAVTARASIRAHTERALQSAQQIIAVSNSLKTEMLKRLPSISRKPIDVIPNGVDATFFDPDRDDLHSEDSSEVAEKIRRITDSAPVSRVIAAIRTAVLRNAAETLTGNGLVKALDDALDDMHCATGKSRLDGQWATKQYAPNCGTDIATKVRAIWIGHFVEVKRVDRLIEAMRIAIQSRPQLELRLVGAGELERVIRRQVALAGLSQATSFAGSLSRLGVRRELSEADFLVISSDVETFGVVGIEAMAMGLPVLATRCGGPDDYITSPELGQIVNPDSQSLAIGMQNMVDRIHGLKSDVIRRHAVADYGFNEVAKIIIEVYRKLLAYPTG